MNETIIILLITVGIPVVSLTLIILRAMENRKERKMAKERDSLSETELRDVYYGLQDISRRIENLEEILYKKNSNPHRDS